MYLESIWSIFGEYLAYILSIFEEYLENIWSIFGVYLAYILSIFEEYLENIWSVFGEYFVLDVQEENRLEAECELQSIRF